MNFNYRMTKVAIVGSIAGALGRAALKGVRGVGKGLVRAGGGGLMGAANVGMSGLQAADDYSKFNQKMLRAQLR